MSCNSTETVSSHDKQVLKQLFNPGLPIDDVDNETESSNADLVEDDAVKESKQLELEGVKAAEAGDVDLALDLFSRAIGVSPQWASGYNNRAQALRLKGDEIGAIADLDKAIELSQGKGNVACQAFTQRGLLKKKNGDDEGFNEDLNKAAKLGGSFAKQLLAAMNPYAAMCNQMLGEVMQRLRNGESEDNNNN